MTVLDISVTGSMPNLSCSISTPWLLTLSIPSSIPRTQVVFRSLTCSSILINTTSIYRKPTHTNMYTHYSSSATLSSKETTVRTLTRRAFKLCSPCHLQPELDHLELTFLSNGYPLRKIRELMQHTMKRLRNSIRATPSKQDSNHLIVSIPYDARHSSSLRKSLSRYNIGTVFHSTNTLRSSSYSHEDSHAS